jgi:Lon protease-like protein
MAELLPLFPLGTVLYPGMVMPLHVFEKRYRRLVRDLLAGPQQRTFGVVAIRHGRETGDEGVSSLYEIGCTAIIREVTPRSDGRYNLTTIGGDRFRLLSQDRSLPYLRGSVELLPDQVGEPAAVSAVAPVRAAFREYLGTLSERTASAVTINDVPDEPVLLSYVVAAAMIIDLPERQHLLEASSALDRLAAERGLLRREIAMLQATGTRPAPDLRHTPYSSN